MGKRALLLVLTLAACAPETDRTREAPLGSAQPLARDAPLTPADRAPPEAPPDTAWTIYDVALEGGGAGVLVREVRVGAHPDAPGYDRVVFETEGDRPGVSLAYVDRPVRTCGAGTPLYPEGDGYLEIRLTGARGHTENGDATIPHERQRRDLTNLRETVPTCDAEGTVTWVLGLRSPEPYRAFWLSDPDRLVVDVRHPAGGSGPPR
jgi:hypothetical protein